MTPRYSRYNRRWRHEIVPLSAALAFPLALATVFPFDAFSSFRSGSSGVSVHASLRTGASASFAFVELTAEDEERALAAARAAWQAAPGSFRRKGPDLFAEALPSDPPRPVVGIAERTRVSAGVAPFAPAEPPTDFRAPPPAVFSAPKAPVAAPLAFPRNDLLELE